MNRVYYKSTNLKYNNIIKIKMNGFEKFYFVHKYFHF